MGTGGLRKPGINREFGEPRTATAPNTTTQIDGLSPSILPAPAQRALEP